MTHAQDWRTVFEKGNGNQTATYQETLDFYDRLDRGFKTISVREIGTTDSGEPLRLVLFNPDGEFDLQKIRKDKAILLVNNGIHPGEPDGIDATMMWLRDLATGKVSAPKNVVVAAIPVYNIGGMLNRGSHSRANQNGPEQYGFRGNERNYDLNRDFVKCDTRNARSFAELFHAVDPDVFIDNHVSNGADYQYTFTYIATHHQKIGGELGQFWNSEMVPALLADLKSKHIESIPYVNIHDEKPDAGFEAFMDYPRYSTGFAALFNTVGSMPETHMLKSYAARVKVTYEYMASTLAYVDAHHDRIRTLKKENASLYRAGSKYPLQWEIDSTQVDRLEFLGYEGAMKPSEVSGKPRLFYDRSKPFRKTIPYYKTYKPSLEVTVPNAYIVPRAWWNVVELLRQNDVQMEPIAADRELEVESYRIDSYQTSKSAYEGHYPHQSVLVSATKKKVMMHRGDWLVRTEQPGVKYLLEMLEPQGVDSFFTWNFFDAILQQKEYFSAYVFEDLAADLLRNDAKLKTDFEKAKSQDAKLAASGEAQLDWVYRHSLYYEPTHLEYPVYRLVD